jgi:fumarate hydratase class I
MAVGGAAYLISKAIKKSRIIAFEDLGMEAIHEFVVEDMPVTVAVSTEGESIHQIAQKQWQKKIGLIPIVEQSI